MDLEAQYQLLLNEYTADVHRFLHGLPSSLQDSAKFVRSETGMLKKAFQRALAFSRWVVGLNMAFARRVVDKVGPFLSNKPN